jgi:pilus assembly protein HofN
MVVMVNLLPWRDARRRQCLRFWALMLVGGLLVIALNIAVNVAINKSERTLNAARVQEARRLQQALTVREQRLVADTAQRATTAQIRVRQQETRRWSLWLSTIGNALPEQAWLTALEWQGAALMLAGKANRFPALAELERALADLPGLRRGKPGATLRDADGRWQFNVQLLPGDADATSP